ncbi:glycosyltransferase family 4 protein [Sulfuricaulis sp.]|jgi:colanic acid/amylovoran biosynthesis glycosyltransferase|uniref:glycosyltransferase family 4 protein n=1 Tax=Sulfuricaulis sp. TaxID=2003553 RepID=UPI0035597F2B
MTNAVNRFVIAYLAPETLAPWATFVYEEFLGLERRGLSVIPISVHRPHEVGRGQEALVVRTLILYDGSKLGMLIQGLAWAPRFGRGAGKALRWLASDMVEQGLLKSQSWKLAFQFLTAVRLARLLKQHHCVHLHVHFAHVSTQIAMYASALSGIPFTVMAHANDIFERGMLLSRKAERALKMLTISEYNRSYLERMGVAADKLAVVRCGVSLVMRPTAPDFERRDRYRIGTLGRLVEKKGMDVLIRAVAELRDRPYRIELSIAGDGPLRNELEALVRSLDLTDTVHFEGSIAHSQVTDWMRSLDAFVLACRKDVRGDMDGIPVVLMEAMSQSVPVISTRLSGIPELVLHEETGLLADPGYHLSLAAQIDRLLESAELRSDLAGRALNHVRREFSQDVNLDRLLRHIGIPSFLPASSSRQLHR